MRKHTVLLDQTAAERSQDQLEAALGTYIQGECCGQC